MALSCVHFHPRTSLQILKLAFRETSIGLIFLDLEIDIACHWIGEAFLNQPANQSDDLSHMLGRFRFIGRPSDSEPPHVLIVGLDIFGGNRVAGNASLICSLDDLVVHVGEVLDEFDLVTAVFQIAPDHVKHERAAGMADVAVVVDRHTTDIHSHSLRLERVERLFFPGEGVVDREHGLVIPPE